MSFQTQPQTGSRCGTNSSKTYIIFPNIGFDSVSWFQPNASSQSSVIFIGKQIGASEPLLSLRPFSALLKQQAFIQKYALHMYEIHKYQNNCSTTDKREISRYHQSFDFMYIQNRYIYNYIYSKSKWRRFSTYESCRLLLLIFLRFEKLTANIKLTMMSIYLAQRIPEFNSSSRFAILLNSI